MKTKLSSCLIILLGILFTNKVIAQAPAISYTGPQTYTAGTTITPLTVSNTGGAPAINGQTSTFAGSGTAGAANGTGTAASFNFPIGVSVDNQGNTYVADYSNDLIRKITPAGVVTTIAGTGGAGFVNGTGTAASFSQPYAVAPDAAGNLYVADYGNNVIRRITPAGVVSTFAGNGTAGYVDGTGAAVEFKHPIGLVVDPAGNVYVADYQNAVIRKITPAGVVSTFAGSGTYGSANGTGTAASFGNLTGLAFDPSGNLIVADYTNNMVRKVTPAQVVTTIAGQLTAGWNDATGTAAKFNNPSNLAVDNLGNIYVADLLNRRIRKIDFAGNVTTLAGTGSSGAGNGAGSAATFNTPFGIAIDGSGTLVVADYANEIVRKVASTPFTINPTLPAGLSLNTATGTISGAAAVASASASYSITAYNLSGNSTASLNITVNAAPAGAQGQSLNQNYVLTNTTRQSGIVDDATLSAAATDKTKVQTAIQYVDGLGRPIQAIQRQASPLGYDMVTPQVYDQYGREVNKYLPYVPITGTAGNYRPAAASTDQEIFYNSPPTGVVQIPLTGQVTYAATRFESSPLQRALEQGSPGQSWQVGGGHTITSSYYINTSGDGVKQWVINLTGGASYSTTYAAGSLYKTTIIDENQNSNAIIEYKDIDGHVVSRWVQNGPSTYYVTDYVYDDLGNLCYVIPPLPAAVNGNPAVPIPTTFAETDNVFLNYFYGYHYDGLHRPTAKKIPGQGWQYVIYDNMDQPILTQDANQNAKGLWMVTKYDNEGRVVLTGEYANTSSPSTLQSTANGNTSNLWENFTNATSFYGYSHNSWPDISTGTGNKVLTVNYFDNYNITNNVSVNPSVSIFTSPNSSIDSLDKTPRSLHTASLVNVLGTNNYLFSVKQYDKYERIVKVIEQFYLRGTLAFNQYDTEENQYSFNGKITQSILNNYLPSSTSPNLTINSWNIYDYFNRPILGKQQYITPINTGSIITLSKVDYNELGQILTQHLHSANSAANPPNNTFCQHVDYRYNSLGFLIKINDPTSLTDQTYPSTIDVFSEQIDYDQNTNGYTGISPQYNGNISSVRWQTYSPSSSGITQEIKGYIYSYDALNRLTNASSKASSSGDNRFNESVTYDELGNILSLARNNGGTNPLNNLIYNYTSAGIRSNILRSVTDNGTVSESQASTYTYDANGSIYSDTKRSLAGMSYNEIGLPYIVPLSAKTLYYTYDANGRKLERVAKVSGAIVDDRSYDDGIEYNAANIEFVHTPTGRALAPTGSNVAYTFEYQLADHIGNIRASFSDLNNDGVLTASEITQTTDYYPFGRESNSFISVTPQRYTYTGKELQDDINEYDYGARFYDPIIARWNVIDPLAYKNSRWSPYVYVDNNPIRLIDPDGMDTDLGSTTIPGETITIPSGAPTEFNDGYQNVRIGGESVAVINYDDNTPNVFQQKDNSIKAFVLSGSMTVKQALQIEEAAQEAEAGSLIENTIFKGLVEKSSVFIFAEILTLKGDNPTQAERMEWVSKMIAKDLNKGDVQAALDDVNRWNKDERNQNDRIVFRYVSTGEFKSIFTTTDHVDFLLPIDKEGVYGAGKHISPDLYTSSALAKDKLALEFSPQVAVWTFESLILPTKIPYGPGNYSKVFRNLFGKGGGFEAKIYQAMPVKGFFILTK